ncbi:hypothetical protein COF52_00715 [Bacillus pseudomycoides]|nr:hypothetical protein COF52_00715 [Bacillus pseudomycoides]
MSNEQSKKRLQKMNSLLISKLKEQFEIGVYQDQVSKDEEKDYHYFIFETGVGLYGMLSQLTKGVQEYVTKTDTRIEKIEPQQPKGNVKHRERPKRTRRPPRRLKNGVIERSVTR